MVEWLKGNFTLQDVLQKSIANHTVHLFGKNNNFSNLMKDMKILRTMYDSRYVMFFNNCFERSQENYLFNDHSQKHKFLVSADTSNIFEVFANFHKDLIITTTITEGFKIFSYRDLSLKQFYPIENITCSATNRKMNKIIYGDKRGRVVLGLIDFKKDKPMDVSSSKWLYTHEGFVKLVSMSPMGNKACSFGYEDQILVIYDLHTLTISSKTSLDLVLSSYCFDFGANKTLMSFESSNELVL